MKRIQGMYFSGTGTTEKIVTSIAEETTKALKDKGFEKKEDINFTSPQARQQIYCFNGDDVVIFGTPVIAGRVPNVLLKFLSTLDGGGAIAIPVVLYGNRNFDDALIELRNILEERGFHTIAAAAFIGEHSFSKVLAAGRPDRDDMKVVADFAKAVAAKLEAMDEIPEPIRVKGQEPIRDYYKPQNRNGEHINILKVRPKLDEGKCTGCGRCVEVCPMGSIKPEAPGIVDGICIKCCGCEKTCPEGALYFDDPGYIYHKEELEFLYAGKRREPEIFLT